MTYETSKPATLWPKLGTSLLPVVTLMTRDIPSPRSRPTSEAPYSDPTNTPSPRQNASSSPSTLRWNRNGTKWPRRLSSGQESAYVLAAAMLRASLASISASEFGSVVAGSRAAATAVFREGSTVGGAPWRHELQRKLLWAEAKFWQGVLLQRRAMTRHWLWSKSLDVWRSKGKSGVLFN